MCKIQTVNLSHEVRVQRKNYCTAFNRVCKQDGYLKKSVDIVTVIYNYVLVKFLVHFFLFHNDYLKVMHSSLLSFDYISQLLKCTALNFIVS